jgi:hypothetical protein
MSNGMELISDGEVKKMGNSYYIRIPAEQVKILGLHGAEKKKGKKASAIEPGSRALIYKEGEVLTVKFPKDGEGKPALFD